MRQPCTAGCLCWAIRACLVPTWLVGSGCGCRVCYGVGPGKQSTELPAGQLGSCCCVNSVPYPAASIVGSPGWSDMHQDRLVHPWPVTKGGRSRLVSSADVGTTQPSAFTIHASRLLLTTDGVMAAGLHKAVPGDKSQGQAHI